MHRLDHQVQGEAGARGGRAEGEDVGREREPDGLRRGESEPTVHPVRLSNNFQMARQQHLAPRRSTFHFHPF